MTIPLVLGSLVSTVKGRVPKYYPCIAGFAIIVAGARTTAMNWRFYQLGTSAWDGIGGLSILSRSTSRSG